MCSIQALLQQGQQNLYPSDTARLDAQILLCHTLQVDRSYLYTASEEKPSKQHKTRYAELIKQRQSGLPVAYLIGKRDFWTLELDVNQHTLIPRPETEHLIDAALTIIDAQAIQKIADLGTGSGAIALSLAHELRDTHPAIDIIATDLSKQALQIAQQNYIKLQLKNVTFKQGSWYQALGQTRFDLIISNPPYIAADHPSLHSSDIQHEPMLALKSGEDGLDAIREIILHAADHLNTQAWLLLEHGYDQKIAIQQLLQQQGFQNIATQQDYASLDRITLAQWP